MPTNPARTDTEKLRAFEQRMTHEGAAGFAAGPTPWESWDEAGSAGTWRVEQDTVRAAHRQRPQRLRKPLGHRVLTSIARLSVLALGVGIAGVYFTSGTEPQLAMNGIQPAPVVVTTGPATGNQRLAGLDESQDSVTVDPNTLPAPAAGRPEIAVVTVTAGARENPAEAQASSDNTDTAGDAAAPAVMPDNSPVATAPAPALQTARPESTDTVAVVQQPAAITATVKKTTPAAEAKTAASAQAAGGVWVVNLASYNHESIAQRMLEEFKDKGVAAELVKVTVNDRPMVRIRTTGYASFREANDWAALLEERLELDGAWVSKR